LSITLTGLSVWLAAIIVAFALTTVTAVGEAQAKSLDGKAKIVDARCTVGPGGR
jgi:hypothetical protein